MILRIALAVFGLVELLVPRKLVRWMMAVTTSGDAEYEFKPWVYKLARLEGVAFLLVAFWWRKNRTDGS